MFLRPLVFSSSARGLAGDCFCLGAASEANRRCKAWCTEAENRASERSARCRHVETAFEQLWASNGHGNGVWR